MQESDEPPEDPRERRQWERQRERREEEARRQAKADKISAYEDRRRAKEAAREAKERAQVTAVRGRGDMTAGSTESQLLIATTVKARLKPPMADRRTARGSAEVQGCSHCVRHRMGQKQARHCLYAAWPAQPHVQCTPEVRWTAVNTERRMQSRQFRLTISWDFCACAGGGDAACS
jgi:hypothetical protein